MSITYTDLTETKFPDAMDEMTRMSDASYAYKDLIAQFYAYKNVGNDSGAAQLLAANPVLKSMILDAATINRFCDIAIALERFFKNDVEGYIEAKFAYLGEYQDNAPYEKGNIVSLNGEGFICRVVSSKGVSPIQHLTTDNWAIIAKQGVQGASGIGLSPRGVWNKSATYCVDDCVADSNILWQCLIENADSKPSADNANWLMLFRQSLSGGVVVDGVLYQSHVEMINGKPQMTFEEVS